MSIRAVLRYADGTDGGSVSISSQSGFETWLEGCRELGLKIVPDFRDIFIVDSSNERDVLDELERLDAWFRSYCSSSYELDLQERVSRLTNLVKEIRTHPGAKVVIV